VHLSRDGVSIASQAEGSARAGGQSDGARRSSASAGLIIEPGRYLERKLAPFRLPARRARAIAMMDIASSTPLDAADIVALFPLDDPAPGARTFLVKKSALLPALRALDKAGARLRRVVVRLDDHLLDLDPGDVTALSSSGSSWSSSLLKAGLLVLAICVAATVAHAHWRQASALGTLDAQIGQLETEVREVRVLAERRDRRLQQVEVARQEKHGSVPVVLIWEELTRVLPDHAWVTDVTVSDGRLTFAGFSTAAAALLPLVEASPLFDRPSFASPVVKSPVSGAERFTIETEIVR
jgi:general secretion pathway protein L